MFVEKVKSVSERHKALARLARQAGIKDTGRVPESAAWSKFLDVVSDALFASDRDRYLLERSLEISSQEMRELNHELCQEKDVLTAVLAALRAGIMHVDRQGRVVYANQTFLKMACFSKIPVGEPASDVVTIYDHTGEVVDAMAVVAALSCGAVWRDEDCRVTKNCLDIPASVVISPVFDQSDSKHPEGFVVSISDSTERNEAIARVRAAEIDVAAAERATAAQASFLANMSHELRTPLNAVIGYSELVAEEAEDFGYTKILPDLDKIQKAGRHLVRLISDVLDMSKIQAGKLELELDELHVSEIARLAIDATFPLVIANQNTLEVDLEENLPPVEADSVRLTQAIVNLVGNAGKFTTGGKVAIRTYLRGADAVVIEVSDTGIGIHPDKLSNLFSAFTQADSSTTRRFGGTGLGLTITRQVTEAMGGRIEVHSRPGEGSSFRLVFPAAGISQGLSTSSATSEPDSGTTVDTILIIDDDHVTHTIIRRFLADSNIAVFSAYTAEEGLAKARDIRPEILLLDIMLPDQDGWELIKQWQADPLLESIPFFVVSSMDERPRAALVGARGCLIKPIDGDEVLKAARKPESDLETSHTPVSLEGGSQ